MHRKTYSYMLLALLAVSLLQVLLVPRAVWGQGRAKWTILVYVAADNDLEPAALKDLAEMEVHGSSQDVNVIVLMDRSERPYEEQYNTEFARALGDWSDARVFYVVKDGYSLSYASRMLEELGEIDTGDPQVLSDFMARYASRYPAEHYALIIWDHGASFGGVAFDYDARDYLTPKEVAEAIRTSGVKLDLIAFDACLMGSYEVAYELRDLADYMVASEETVPNDGFPYDYVLGKLYEEPGMGAEELGRAVIEAYSRFYTKDSPEPTATLSLIDLRALRGTVDLARRFAEAAVSAPRELKEAREGAEQFGGGGDASQGASNVDLPMLLERLGGSGEVGKAASDFLGALDKAIVAHWEGEKHRGARGLTIYFPLRYDGRRYRDMSSFASETRWPQALEKAVNVEADIGVPGESIQVYEEDASSLVSEASGENIGGNVYARIATLGALDMDGDGKDEVAVVLYVYDFESQRTLIPLTIYGYNGSTMNKLHSKLIAAVPETVFVRYVGARKADDGGDGRWELYMALNRIDYSGDMPKVDSWIIKVWLENGELREAKARLDNAVINGFDDGDVDGDGETEIVVGGLRLPRQQGEEARSYLAVLRAGDLHEEMRVEASRPDMVVSGVRAFRAGNQGKDLVALSVNYVERGGQGPVLKECEVQVVDIGREGVRPIAVLGRENTAIISIDAGDVDSDGLAEILAVTKRDINEGGVLNMFKFDGGKLSVMASTELGADGYVGLGAFIYDLDGDGIREVYTPLGEVIDAEDGYVEMREIHVYYWASADGRLVEENRINLGEEKEVMPLPADVNGDERLDMVYVQRVNATLQITVANISNYVDPLGTIEGVVLDDEGNPVQANITVYMSKQTGHVASVLSGPDGGFKVRVPAGTYYVRATLASGDSMRVTAIVEPSKKVSVTLDFRKKTEQQNPWIVQATTTTTATEPSTTTQPTSTITTTTTTATSQPPTQTTTTTTATTSRPTGTATTVTVTVTQTPSPSTTAGETSTTTTTSTQASRPQGTGTATTTVTVTVGNPTGTAGGPQATGSETAGSGRAAGEGLGIKALVVLLAVVAAGLWILNRRRGSRALALLLIPLLLAPCINVHAYPARSAAGQQHGARPPWWVTRGLRVTYAVTTGSSVVSPWVDWRATLKDFNVPMAQFPTTIYKQTGKASVVQGFDKYVVTEVRPDRVVAYNSYWFIEVDFWNSFDVEARPRNNMFNGPFWVDPALLAGARPGRTILIPGQQGPVPYTVLFVGRMDLSPLSTSQDSLIKTLKILLLPVPKGTYREVVILRGKPPVNQQQFLGQRQGRVDAYHEMVVDRELGLILYEGYGEIQGGAEAGGGLKPIRSSVYVRRLVEITLDLEDRLPPYRTVRLDPLAQPGYSVSFSGAAASVFSSSTISVTYWIVGMYKHTAMVMEQIFHGTTSPIPLAVLRAWLVDLETGEANLLSSVDVLTGKPLDEGHVKVKATYLWIDGQAGRDTIEVQGKRYVKENEEMIDASKYGLTHLKKIKVYIYRLESPSGQGLEYIRLYYMENGLLAGIEIQDSGMEMNVKTMSTTLRMVASMPVVKLEEPHRPTDMGQEPANTTKPAETEATTTATSGSPAETGQTTTAAGTVVTSTVTKTVTETKIISQQSSAPQTTPALEESGRASGERGGGRSDAPYVAAAVLLAAFIAYQVYIMVKRR